MVDARVESGEDAGGPARRLLNSVGRRASLANVVGRRRPSPRIADRSIDAGRHRSGGHAGCSIERSDGRAGRSARSATACGGWPGWTGSDDDETIGRARAGRRARLQLLRHRLGLRRRPQRAAARPPGAQPSRQASSTSPPRSRPRTASGPRGAGSRSTTASRPTTSASMPRRACENLGLPRIDLLQFHVWEDAWAHDERWQRAIDDLKRAGADPRRRASASTAGSRPTCSRRLRTGLIDAVQVIYNIFDQAPEDELFPALPRAERRA